MSITKPENNTESTSELSEKYVRSAKSAGDAPAMQAAVCIILAASVFVLNILMPGAAMYIFHRISSLAASSDELIPNPLEFLLSIIDKA